MADDDARLVARMAAGDLDGLGTLFDRYGDPVRRFVLRMGVREADADDLVQNTFLGALHSSSRFDAEYPARAWLFGIAAMMVRRYRRSAARFAARLRDWAQELPSSAVPPPDGLAEQHEQSVRLSQAIERLAPKKREAFTLVVLEGVSGEQAARALGVPVNTIWTRLHHARRELRECLDGDEPEEVRV
jgi:RNA polymerase sigma-70 factor (ECF subfamily)